MYEPLKVPSDCKAGDRIIIDGYNNTKAEVPQLNPKKKVWDKIQSELKINGSGEAIWRDFSMMTLSEEPIRSNTLTNCNIK